MNLTNLTGSEKQIAWAEDIRNRMARTTDPRHIVAHIQNTGDRLTEADIDRAIANWGELSDETLMRVTEAVFNAHPDAAWWIDNRARVDLVEEVAAKIFA